MAELFVVNGICGGTVFFLPDVPTVVGRSPECHVQVADPWISSMHALFELRGDQLWVVDLDSRNGTFVNDERVHEAPVAPGNRVRFGKTTTELRPRQDSGEQRGLLAQQNTIIRYIADLKAESEAVEERTETHLSVPRAPGAAPSEPRRTLGGPGQVTGIARRQIAILNEIGRALVGAHGRDDALARILRILSGAVGAERSSVLLMGEHGEMVPVVSEPRDQPPRLSGTVVASALGSRAGILTLDAQQDLRFSQSQSVIAQGIRSCICAPIWADNRILGAVLLERGLTDPFNAEDLELATVVGFQAALAVERSRIEQRAAAAEEQRQRLQRYLHPSAAAPLLQAEASDRDALEPALREDVAVLAASLDGVEALAARRSAAEAAARVLELQRALADTALALGAAVDAQLSGEILAVFGLIQPMPEAPARALRCALAMLERAAAAEARHPGPRLTLRIGVDAGRVLAGNYGTADRPEIRAMGEAVDSAFRARSAAQQGTVLAGRGAAERAGRAFSLERLGDGRLQRVTGPAKG